MRSAEQLQAYLDDPEFFRALYQALHCDARHEDAWERYREFGADDPALRGFLGEIFVSAPAPEGCSFYGGHWAHMRWRGVGFETLETVALARMALRLPYPVLLADSEEPMPDAPHLVPTDPSRRPFRVLHRGHAAQGAEGQSAFFGLENALYYCAALRTRVNYAAGGYLRLEEHPEGEAPILLAQGSESGLTMFFRGAKPYSLSLVWSPSYEQIEEHLAHAVASDVPPPGPSVPDLRSSPRRVRFPARPT